MPSNIPPHTFVDPLPALQGWILGSELQPGFFIDSGAASRRTVLLGDEQIITRVLNSLDIKSQRVSDATDGFKDRFNNVIGSEVDQDRETFEAIGSNLINAVYQLQEDLNNITIDTEYFITNQTLSIVISDINVISLDSLSLSTLPRRNDIITDAQGTQARILSVDETLEEVEAVTISKQRIIPPISSYVQGEQYRENYFVKYQDNLYVVNADFTADDIESNTQESLEADVLAGHLTPVSTSIDWKPVSDYAEDTEYKKDFLVVNGTDLYRVVDDFTSADTGDLEDSLADDILSGYLVLLSSSVVELEQLKEDFETHASDTTLHLETGERDLWNNKANKHSVTQSYDVTVQLTTAGEGYMVGDELEVTQGDVTISVEVTSVDTNGEILDYIATTIQSDTELTGTFPADTITGNPDVVAEFEFISTANPTIIDVEQVWDKTEDLQQQLNNIDTGGIEEAPEDGGIYSRQNSDWIQIAENVRKGVGGIYTQVSGIPANEFEFNDLQQFLDEKINGHWFDTWVWLEITTLNSPRTIIHDVFLEGGDSWDDLYLEINSTVPVNSYLQISNITGRVGVWGTLASPFNDFNADFSNCGYVDFDMNKPGTNGQLRFRQCNTVKVGGNIDFVYFTVDRGSQVTLSYGRKNFLVLHNYGTLFISDGITDLNPQPHNIHDHGIIVDNRPGRPLDTMVVKDQGTANAGKKLGVGIDGKVTLVDCDIQEAPLNSRQYVRSGGKWKELDLEQRYVLSDWESQTPAANYNYTSVCYGNDIFVAVSLQGAGFNMMTSPDGITWTLQFGTANNHWRSVCYGNGLFVAVASYSPNANERVATSPDGINWTAQTTPAENYWTSVCYGNDMFVAVANTGTGNRVMTSPDGINWTSQTSAADLGWASVCYGNGMFVAVSSYGANRVMTSEDGIVWTLQTSPFECTWHSVCYDNDLFVAVGKSDTLNNVMTSPDGINWTLRSGAANYIWSSVCYGHNTFVAVAMSGTGNRCMISPDGINWSLRETSADVSWASVCYGNETFVAVALNAVMRSAFEWFGYGVTEAPLDGKQYARQDAEWSEIDLGFVSEYEQSKEYQKNTFIVYSDRVFLVLQDFTADDVEATTQESLEADILAGNLIPVSADIDFKPVSDYEEDTEYKKDFLVVNETDLYRVVDDFTSSDTGDLEDSLTADLDAGHLILLGSSVVGFEQLKEDFENHVEDTNLHFEAGERDLWNDKANKHTITESYDVTVQLVSGGEGYEIGDELEVTQGDVTVSVEITEIDTSGAIVEYIATTIQSETELTGIFPADTIVGNPDIIAEFEFISTANPTIIDVEQVWNKTEDLQQQINNIETDGIEEAPIDGKQYGRQDASWTEVEATGKWKVFEEMPDATELAEMEDEDLFFVEDEGGGSGGNGSNSGLDITWLVIQTVSQPFTLASNSGIQLGYPSAWSHSPSDLKRYLEAGKALKNETMRLTWTLACPAWLRLRNYAGTQDHRIGDLIPNVYSGGLNISLTTPESYGMTMGAWLRFSLTTDGVDLFICGPGNVNTVIKDWNPMGDGDVLPFIFNPSLTVNINEAMPCVAVQSVKAFMGEL